MAARDPTVRFAVGVSPAPPDVLAKPTLFIYGTRDHIGLQARGLEDHLPDTTPYALAKIPGANARTPIRYVCRGVGQLTWKRRDGTWPKKGEDWKYATGPRGGGDKSTGHGPIFVRKRFLKHVYCSKYIRS